MNAMAPVSVHRAGLADLEALIPLFDAYRQFYGQSTDLLLARRFLYERLSKEQSIVLLAQESAAGPAGFTQLFPSYSSVFAARLFILNDLFVAPSCRRRGVATALLTAAVETARAAGAATMRLSTGIENAAAQRLYEGLGWQRNTTFREYHLVL